jgi:hypothetical protein
MPNCKLKQIQTYMPPNDVPKITKKRGEKGFISNSAYLRSLIIQDLRKKD